MKHAIYNTLIFGLLTAATAAVLFSIGVSLGHAQSAYLYSDGERYPYGSDGIRDSHEMSSPWHSTANPTLPPSSSPYSSPYLSPYGDSQQRQSVEPPAPVTRDFNVWKDGKPTLCTAIRSGDVYCY
jgi:hypothetical protein